MSELYIYDDARAREFEPFALVRPTAELRAGALLLRERWERAIGRPATGLVCAVSLGEFTEAGVPPVVSGTLPAGAILANSRCAVSIATAAVADVWRCGDRVAAVRLNQPVPFDQLATGACTLENLTWPSARNATVDGRWIDETWHFIRDLPAQLNEDIAVMAAGMPPMAVDHTTCTGTHSVFVERGATVEPMVFFDLTAGPVLICEGATVQAFTRLVGPCVVGRRSTVAGGRIATSAIGDACKVHGELSTSIILGHSNKGHDGFVGHSYLGRWVNLGAGTTTSNLKNTYGSVALWTRQGIRDTGLQYLGALLGDYVKTGIGVRLTTGTVVGAGASIFGGTVMPKVVPPFAWGEAAPFSTYELPKFLTAAERMMRRRDVALSDHDRARLSAAHAARWTAR